MIDEISPSDGDTGKAKALYGKLVNDLYYSSKTVKGDSQLTVNLLFQADAREATLEDRDPLKKIPLTLTITNNGDGTATLTITGSGEIQVDDRRGKLE